MELDASSSILSPEVSLGLGGDQVQTYSLLLYLKVKKNRNGRERGSQQMVHLDLRVRGVFRLMNNQPERQISPAGRIITAGH